MSEAKDDLIARATEEAAYLERENCPPLSTRVTLRDCAARIASLTEALEPFSEAMDVYEQHCRDEMDWVPPPEHCDDEYVEMLALTGNHVKLFKLSAMRAARAALSNTSEGGGRNGD